MMGLGFKQLIQGYNTEMNSALPLDDHASKSMTDSSTSPSGPRLSEEGGGNEYRQEGGDSVTVASSLKKCSKAQDLTKP